jgi:hypothetical protein
MENTPSATDLPQVRNNKLFSKTILDFPSKLSFVQFYKIAENIGLNNNYQEFKSLNKWLKKFNSNAISYRTNNENLDDTASYLYNLKLNLINNDAEGEVLNEDLQVIIEDTFYQVTRIGTFKCAQDKIDSFLSLYNLYEEQILFNPNFDSIPHEIELADGNFMIGNNVYRIPTSLKNIFDDEMYLNGNYSIPIGGSSPPPPCSTSLPQNLQYNQFMLGSDFNRSDYIEFEDRRFVLKAFNNNFLGIINEVGLKAKLQRKRRFLGINYWGESFADEIILGINNMDLRTSYVFPTPQQFNTLSRPQFLGIVNFPIGNHIIEAIGFNINVNIPLFGTNITNADAINFLNGQFNSFVNNTFNDLFSPIVNNIIAEIDPSYPTRYANYAKRVNSLMESNRYRISVSNAKKPEGYSHKNVWRFDWNIGAIIIPGPNTFNPTYTYDMKSGNFYALARVGCKWYGIKMVKL